MRGIEANQGKVRVVSFNVLSGGRLYHRLCSTYAQELPEPIQVPVLLTLRRPKLLHLMTSHPQELIPAIALVHPTRRPHLRCQRHVTSRQSENGSVSVPF